jgi:hypothetical protein
MPSEEVPGAPAVITDRARAPAAAAVPRAWDLEEVAAVVDVVAGGDVDKRPRYGKEVIGAIDNETKICEGKPPQGSFDRGYIGVSVDAR